MNNHLFRVAVMLIGLFPLGVLSSCDTYSEPAPVQDDLLEPNNSQSEAAKINVDYQADLVLQDDDWFTFTLAEAKLVNVSAEAPYAQYWNVSAYIYEKGSDSLAGFDFGNDRRTNEGYVYLPAGKYFLQLAGYVESETRAYRVSVSSKEIPDVALEPNDTLQSATKLDLNTEAKEMFLQEEDEDWFTFTLGEPRIVTIDFSEERNYPSFEKTLYDKNFKPYEDRYWTSLTTALEPGTYYIRAYTEDEFFTGGTSYSLSVHSEPVPDTLYEPNDSFNQATEITLPFQGDFFIYGGDEDWFTFSVLKEKLVTLSRKNDSGEYSLSGKIYRNDGEQIHNFSLTSLYADSFVLPPGTYRVSLTPPTPEDYYSERGFSYPLAIVSEDISKADYEPNDTFQEASKIEVGFSEEALLVSRDDDDWFTFDVDTAAQIRIATKQYSNGPPSIDLYDADRNLVRSADQGLLSSVLAPGAYYIAIEDYYSDSLIKYGLSVTKE